MKHVVCFSQFGFRSPEVETCGQQVCPKALGSCPLGGARSRKGNQRRHRQPAQHCLLHHQEVSIAAAFPTAFAAPHLYLCVCVQNCELSVTSSCTGGPVDDDVWSGNLD